METPILYVKTGCPWCRAAMEWLDENQVTYEQRDVRADRSLMKKLHEVSGQEKTPTMVWDGDVLADFGVEELEQFAQKHRR